MVLSIGRVVVLVLPGRWAAGVGIGQLIVARAHEEATPGWYHDRHRGSFAWLPLRPSRNMPGYGLPLWIPIILFGLYSGTSCRRAWAARLVLAGTNCARCGYALAGLPDGAACPECGRAQSDTADPGRPR